MATKADERDELLAKLDETVTNVAACFAKMARRETVGQDTAFAVLARLVFWHQQYVNIARDLVVGRKPHLLTGSFETLNAKARVQYWNQSMLSLVFTLKSLQTELRQLLLQLPDWSVNFPVKFDSEKMTVAERVAEINSVIAMHTKHFEECKNV